MESLISGGGDFTMNRIQKFGATLSLLAVAMVAGATSAFATTQSTKDQVTTMATNAFGEATPIVIAVAGAAVALSVALFGSRLVLRAIKGGGRV